MNPLFMRKNVPFFFWDESTCFLMLHFRMLNLTKKNFVLLIKAFFIIAKVLIRTSSIYPSKTIYLFKLWRRKTKQIKIVKTLKIWISNNYRCIIHIATSHAMTLEQPENEIENARAQ